MWNLGGNLHTGSLILELEKPFIYAGRLDAGGGSLIAGKNGAPTGVITSQQSLSALSTERASTTAVLSAGGT